MPHHVIGYRLPQHVAAYARYSEVNPAEYACVRNLSYRIGEARERPRRPGRTSDVTVNAVSLPNILVSTSAAEPLTVECPEGYSGWGGVPVGRASSHGTQPVSTAVEAFMSRSPSRIAVIGRQKTNRYLLSQHAITASAMLMFIRANRWALCVSDSECASRNLHRNPVPVQRGISCPEQYKVRLIRAARRAAEHSPGLYLVVIGGILCARQCVRRRKPELRRPLQHPGRHRGKLRARAGSIQQGVGRHTPISAGVPTRPSAPTKGGGGGKNPSVNLQFQTASATFWPQAIPALIDFALSPLSAAIDASRSAVSDVVSVGYCLTRIAYAAWIAAAFADACRGASGLTRNGS